MISKTNIENNMTAKERFDAISILYKQSWENFNERRKYEWKINFAVYTIYALSISGVLLYDKIIVDRYLFIGGIAFGGILFLIHLFWLNGIGKANFIDRKIALHYESFLQQLSSSEFYNDFKRDYLNNSNLSKNHYIVANWNHFLQVGVSLCFYFVLVFIMTLKL